MLRSCQILSPLLLLAPLCIAQEVALSDDPRTTPSDFVRFVKVDLSDPMRLAYLKSDVFHSLGRDAEFSELADEERGLPGMAKREIDGAVLRVRKRSREAYGKTFLDVFINGTVSLSGGASAPPEVPAGSRPVEYVDGDEIPF